MNFERDYVVKGPIQMQMYEERKNRNFDKVVAMPLADVIYIFPPDKKKGIKFYSSFSSEAFEQGKYVTDIHSIKMVEWDERTNIVGGPRMIKTPQGQFVVVTYVVSEKDFLMVLRDIANQKNNEKIIVNIGMKNINTYNNDKSNESDLNNIDFGIIFSDFENIIIDKKDKELFSNNNTNKR